LGYSLSHAFGAAFDNSELIVACVVGDGEAETGPLATAWQSNKMLDPITDGAVLPILHLNGYKISNPTILSGSNLTNWISFLEAVAGHLFLWKVMSRKKCMNSWRLPWKEPSIALSKFKRMPGPITILRVRAGR